jgi:hypothetical protein
MTEALQAISADKQGSQTSLASCSGIESLTSISTNLFMNGIAFYMSSQYHWSATQNLVLMMVQGAVYAFAALLAGKLVRLFDQSKALLGSQLILTLLLIPLAFVHSLWLLVPLLLAVASMSTLTWPITEGLVTQHCNPVQMSRRITVYNLTWSITGVLVIAVYGTVMYYWPHGPMVIPVIGQSIALLLAFRLWRSRRTAKEQADTSHAHAPAHEGLLQVRRLALWLSRISLPACFVVANSLMGFFSTMPASLEMGVKLSTFIASLWMAGRVLAFVVLGMTTWWQSRPRLLLIAAALLLLSFLAIVVPAERVGLFASSPLALVIAVMVLAELVLGIAVGFIYSGSLYFGMVLSEGSTEQGGYHECLIGMGIVIGPGFAAAAQQLAVGGSHWPGIGAVSGLMLLTIAAAGWISASLRPAKPPVHSSNRKSFAKA